MTATGAIPDTASRSGRQYHYSGDHRDGVLVVSGRGGGSYWLQWVAADPAEPSQPLAALLLRTDTEDGEIYAVRCGRGGGCSCWGWRRWRVCKHFSCVSAVAAELAAENS